MPFRLLSAVLLAVALSACTGTPQRPHLSIPPPLSGAPHTSAATASTVATPSRTGPLTTGPNTRPGESPPTPLPATSEHNQEGALFYADYFFEAFDWSVASNDSYMIRAASERMCQACNRVIERIDLLARNRQTLHGGRLSVESSRIVTGSFTVHADFAVEVRTNQADEFILDSRGRRVSSATGRTETSLVFVDWTTAGWRVHEVSAPS